ncbi:hypothetical protein [Croceivirga sp. JEA036]|uniref:hypothetical protein n=1 Tax=Croceivirga sp. JEA036 TaxID=2721162 RepID=UPI00143CBCD8|nr:hypothetical protein [Croceivirga sp. JEA036]NJB35561.1 hypothetical protein [Croceivirga sp. JEA036]
MQRKIVDYKKLSHEVAAKLIDRYPHGYGDDDIYIFQKPSGEIVEAVEVKTEDTIYLVKISKSLSNFITNFAETIESEMNSEEDSTADLPDFDKSDAA